MARLPLQVGTSSLRSLALGAAALVPGAILTAITTWIAFELDDALGDVGGYVGTLMVTGALALLIFAFYSLRTAWRARPSDIRIDAEGFVVEGGRHHGTRVEWLGLPRGEKGCHVQKPTPPPKDSKESDPELWMHRLWVRIGSQDVLFAMAEEDDEAAALENIAATLRGGAESARSKKPKTKGVDALACASCGANVPPEDEAEVTCAFCQARCPIPEDVRTRVRESADVAKRPNRVIAKLLDQPSAPRLTILFGIAGAFMLVAWPAAILVFARAVDEEAATFMTAVTMLLFVGSTILGFYAFVRGRLVDCVALRLLMFELAADAPAKEGEPFRCRSCTAPLPPAGIERAIVTCAYCSAENVLVRDIHREASAAREDRRSVEEALVHRKRERERLRGIGFLAAGLLAVAAFSLRHGFAENPVVAPVAKKCNAGDVDACIDLGELYAAGAKKGVKYAPTRSAKLFEHACDAGKLRACAELAELHAHYELPKSDQQRALALRTKACDGGWAPSCASLAEVYLNGDLLAHVKRDPKKAKDLYSRACAGGVAEACKR